MGIVVEPAETAFSLRLVNTSCVGCHFAGVVEVAESDVVLLRLAVFRVRLDALVLTSWPKAVAVKNKRVIEVAKVFNDVRVGFFKMISEFQQDLEPTRRFR